MRVIVGCEFSQVVTKAFREKGHDAFSCDLLPTEGNPEWHFQCNILDILDRDWDLGIFHPPCTYISNMSNCRIKEDGREELRKSGMEFFMKIINAPIEKIAVENPRGLPEREYRKPDQVIQPYYFGHPYSKATCLWLKNLPPLLPLLNNVMATPIRKWDGRRWRTWVDFFSSHNSKQRSITFPGIAEAMAAQWGGHR